MASGHQLQMLLMFLEILVHDSISSHDVSAAVTVQMSSYSTSGHKPLVTCNECFTAEAGDGFQVDCFGKACKVGLVHDEMFSLFALELEWSSKVNSCV